ncbi:MAG TPA: VOC family protein [Sphingomicrobium sp.]|nr:VOC family protein [Sphingomicrobium sp.]
MPNRHGEFIWYELLTAEPEEAKAFYEPVVGWRFGEPSPDHAGYREIRTETGHAGGVLPLTQEMRDHGARPTWLGYVGVDDVDATVAKAQAAGATLLMPAWDIAGIGRIALLADPQGAPFYVMRGASEEASDAFSPDSVGHATWNELTTSDLEAAKLFYLPLFGWTLGDTMPMGEMGDYQFLEHGGRMIGAMMQRGDTRPSWNFCFRTADLERSVDDIKARGGSVTYGPAEVPGGERIVVALDPESSQFMLIAK